jgi:hypothetical protein
MDKTIAFEQEFAELNKALAVLNIQLDFTANSVKCILNVAEGHNKTVIFDGIIDIQYAPDFSDSPPWVFGDVQLERVSRESELRDGEGLWVREKGSYDGVLPCYRVSFESGDFRLKIICRNIDVIDS